MLIFKIVHECCPCPISRYRRPMLWLTIALTKSHFNYRSYMTQNHSLSIGAHFQNSEGSISYSRWTVKNANTWVIPVSNQLPLSSLNTQDNTTFTFCWHSFPEWGNKRISPHVGYEGYQYIQELQWHTKVNIWWLRVRCLNDTINGTLQHMRLEIGADRKT